MKLKTRRLSVVVVVALGIILWLVVNPESYEEIPTRVEGTDVGAGLKDDLVETTTTINENTKLAIEVLQKLEVKGRAPKTGYAREEFYSGWPTTEGCNLRQRILKRELGDTAILDGCIVIAGEFDEPYTGEHLILRDRTEVAKIQIDHVVALSDAWQKGAQYKDYETRNKIATDPLNLLAVDGKTNQSKSDGDAATWLPPNKRFRCQYVARQVSVKYKYGLWVSEAEKETISRILANCPNEPAIGV